MSAACARAEESRKVPISFVPPPLESATYSLGVYGVKSGKLVRRLQEIAPESAFTVGLNGLMTSWDGKDDAGKAVEPGRYAVRGYAVGPLKIEGEGIYGNDWVGDDEGLRMRFVSAIAFVPEDGGLLVFGGDSSSNLFVARYGGDRCQLRWQKSVPGVRVLVGSPAPRCSLSVQGDRVIADEVAAEGSLRIACRLADGQEVALPAGEDTKFDPSDRATGRDGTIWQIEDGMLSQSSAQGERLRRMAKKEDEPLPVAVAASKTSDRLYLLEASKGTQRVRGLSWKETSKEGDNTISTWTTFFERNILHLSVEGLRGLVGTTLWYELEVTLVGNPLSNGKPERVKLMAGGGRVAADGSADGGGYLTTAAGLRLRQISQRSHVGTGELAKGKTPNSILFFQDDGTAWDEFSIEGLKNIMAFDAGEIELTSTGEKSAEKIVEPPDL